MVPRGLSFVTIQDSFPTYGNTVIYAKLFKVSQYYDVKRKVLIGFTCTHTKNEKYSNFMSIWFTKISLE